MVAAVRINSSHGASDDASTTDVAGATIYFKASGDTDTNTSGVTGAGTNNSLIKSHRIYVQSAPIHAISNLKFYWSGTQVTGIDVKGKISATYIDHVAQGTTTLAGTTSMYTYTSLVPLSQDGSFVTGTDTAPKFIGNFLIMQLSTNGASVANNVVLGSLIARYDEQ